MSHRGYTILYQIYQTSKIYQLPKSTKSTSIYQIYQNIKIYQNLPLTSNFPRISVHTIPTISLHFTFTPPPAIYSPRHATFSLIYTSIIITLSPPLPLSPVPIHLPLPHHTIRSFTFPLHLLPSDLRFAPLLSMIPISHLPLSP